MLKFIPYVVKNIWRHRARTLLTVSGTMVALMVFSVIGSVQQGMMAITQGELAERTLIVFQKNRFCPQSSRLPQDYETSIAKLPGVAGVVPLKVFTNNCRASLDSIVFHGLPADQMQTHRDFKLLSGMMSEFLQRDDSAFVGKDVAKRRGLVVGEKFTIGQISVVVSGIFKSLQAAENSLIYTQLDFLQRAQGTRDVGTVTQFEVHLTEQADPEHLATTIDQTFQAGPVNTTTRTQGMFQADTLADLAELIGYVHWLAYACVGLVLSLVATTTVMSVQDRVAEHAVLQTLGLRPSHVFGLVVLESLLLSTCGGIFAAVLSMLLLTWGNLSLATEGVAIAFQGSLQLVLQAIVIGMSVGLLAGLLPGWQAARANIVPALRQA